VYAAIADYRFLRQKTVAEFLISRPQNGSMAVPMSLFLTGWRLHRMAKRLQASTEGVIVACVRARLRPPRMPFFACRWDGYDMTAFYISMKAYAVKPSLITGGALYANYTV
jgi:hypothetical protein